VTTFNVSKQLSKETSPLQISQRHAVSFTSPPRKDELGEFSPRPADSSHRQASKARPKHVFDGTSQQLDTLYELCVRDDKWWTQHHEVAI
jgi:hypothetical protein